MNIGTKANKTPVAAGYHEAQLKRQIGYLERSCGDFDRGDHDEAIRIAVTLRVLLHDTNNSTSLLTHLGIKSTIEYVDTGIYRPLLDAALAEWAKQNSSDLSVVSRTPSDVGLVELGDAGAGRVGWFAPLRLQRFAQGTPHYNACPRISDFDFWWRSPLVEASSGKRFSRWDLVNIMANQDGGAHVDQVGLDADYQDLMVDFLGVGMAHGVDLDFENLPESLHNVPKALHNVAFASVRQIAFELMVSLRRREWVRQTSGIFAFSEPFRDINLPEPPHRPMLEPQSIILGKYI
ncbi:hypothetical protein ACC702_31980 [Rhizobium ruizarguesonis]|uniref:hypothetical protein n=1 Tax=Rhizobium ruizarguesonis TaxID=2081791 RepID=UPI0010302D70|nr:hypothetical protein [Rhizobium ruizarguesonis]TAU03561.1 hypothetical protein ELI55_00865 [Rhizobium ruizarguesonis]TAU46691.1 hypothetical protein ELI42_00855 [Rhizobium ruizarguesonis]TAU61762.1 hypothetical protein ELI44_00860 [Rhizobium ruizarguesonis]TAZ38135.1 hypothetical protein ELH74_01055 [Rhizobium ruizarguesonis]TBD19590.1 hypothetical protein ELH23_00860 [Rhizobium ruizarguesonis]